MGNKDNRSEISKKIEEAIARGDFDAVEDLIEMPSPETFNKWVDLGQERYMKRTRRNRILATCAIFVVVCISALVAIKCIAPPEVEAGPEGKVGIDITDMESTTTYESWSDLPTDIKDQFIEIKNLPDGYEVEKIVVEEGTMAKKVNVYIKQENSEIIIRQYFNLDGTIPSITVTDENSIVSINGYKVYKETIEYMESVTYKYVVQNAFIDIVASTDIEEGVIGEILNAVQQ